jgi:hypothetical protein
VDAPVPTEKALSPEVEGSLTRLGTQVEDLTRLAKSQAAELGHLRSGPAPTSNTTPVDGASRVSKSSVEVSWPYDLNTKSGKDALPR